MPEEACGWKSRWSAQWPQDRCDCKQCNGLEAGFPCMCMLETRARQDQAVPGTEMKQEGGKKRGWPGIRRGSCCRQVSSPASVVASTPGQFPFCQPQFPRAQNRGNQLPLLGWTRPSTSTWDLWSHGLQQWVLQHQMKDWGITRHSCACDLASANVQLGLCGYYWLAALEPADAGDPQLS